jgi:hypothetical protein
VGDVLIAKSGRVGTAAVNSLDFPFSVFESIAIVRPNSKFDPYYLAAFLNSSYAEAQIERNQKGAVQRHLHLEDLRKIYVAVASPKLQQAIGNKVRKAERLRSLAADIRTSTGRLIAEGFGPIPLAERDEVSWVPAPQISKTRLDAWFHRPSYLAFDRFLQKRSGLIQVESLCRTVTDVADLSSWLANEFPYFEIGGLSAETGEAVPTPVRCNEAPSRAKYLVISGDVLVSTVRPNLRAISQVPSRYDRAVCSSGFAVLRADHPAVGAYVRACLVQEASTMQLMRWNTGEIYPAIDHLVPSRVWIPDLGSDHIREVGESLLKANDFIEEATGLVNSALIDVDALISGNINVAAVVSKGDEIGKWLALNPSPNASKRRSHATSG